MNTGFWLLLYGTALAFAAPPVLRRITRSGLSPQMGVAAWLTALATTLMAWCIALVLIGLAAADALLDSSAVALCLQLFGFSAHSELPGLQGAIAVLMVGIATTVVVVWRTRRSMAGLRTRSHEHARAVLMVGRSTTFPGAVIVDAPRPAVYCVSGHPSAIVITSAAWSSLSGPEMAAVLAHEQAHLTGRHHQVLMLLRALTTAFPRLPLMQWSAPAVAELLEMCADDAAARRHGVSPLLRGLLAMAEPHPAPAGGLAAASTAIAVRAMRLAHPAHGRVQWCHRVLLGLTMTSMLGAPAFIELLCHH